MEKKIPLPTLVNNLSEDETSVNMDNSKKEMKKMKKKKKKKKQGKKGNYGR